MNTCSFCDAAFVPSYKTPWQKYCSMQCNKDATAVRAGRNTKAVLMSRRASVGTRRPCERCGKTFVVENTPAGIIKRFCTDQCRISGYKTSRQQKIRSYALKRNYDLTPTQYTTMLAAQGGKCAICNQPPGPKEVLCVDHDHSTGAVRGLLCRGCNLAVGFFEKRQEALLRYLFGRSHI